MKQPVFPGHKVIAMFPFFNEERKLRQLVGRITDGLVDQFVGVNDGSTDGSADLARVSPNVVVFDQARSGIGAALRRCVHYARENDFDILVVLAGNGKDDPQEIPRLVGPIVQNQADYVQGSRFLGGGSSPNLPVFRRYAIRLLSSLFALYFRKPCTDLTNGFRAYRIALLGDSQVDIEQSWLDTYEMEYYIHFKAYQLGYRVTEVPVSKSYPSDPNESYTKIRPFSGWWRMLRPLIFLALGVRK